MPSIVFPQSYFLGVTKRKEQDVTYGRLRARSADGSPSVFVLFAETAVALDRELSLLIPRGTDLRDARLALELEGTTRSRPRTNAKGVTTVEHYLEVTKFTVLTGPAAELQMARREGFDAATKAAGLAAVGDHAGAYAALASFAHPFSRFDDAVPGEILEDEADAEATQSVSPGTTPAPDAPAASEVEIVPVAVEAPAARPEAAEDPALSVEATEPSPETVPETGVPPAGPETPVPVGTAPVDPEAGSPASAEDGATVAPDAGVDLEAIAEVPVESFSDAGHVAARSRSQSHGRADRAGSSLGDAGSRRGSPRPRCHRGDRRTACPDRRCGRDRARRHGRGNSRSPRRSRKSRLPAKRPSPQWRPPPPRRKRLRFPFPRKQCPSRLPLPCRSPASLLREGSEGERVPCSSGPPRRPRPLRRPSPIPPPRPYRHRPWPPRLPCSLRPIPRPKRPVHSGWTPSVWRIPALTPSTRRSSKPPARPRSPPFMSRPRFGGPRRMPPLPEPVAAGGMRP